MNFPAIATVLGTVEQLRSAQDHDSLKFIRDYIVTLEPLPVVVTAPSTYTPPPGFGDTAAGKGDPNQKNPAFT